MHRSFFAHYNLNCLLNKVIIDKNDANELKPGCSKRLCVIAAFISHFYIYKKKAISLGDFFSPQVLVKKKLKPCCSKKSNKGSTYSNALQVLYY